MPAHDLAREAQPDAGAFAGVGLGTRFRLLGWIEGNENFFHGFFGDAFYVVNYIILDVIGSIYIEEYYFVNSGFIWWSKS